jgi:hypothetical protein
MLLPIALFVYLAAPPADHLFPIREGRHFGFIDRGGAVVVAPQYDAVGKEREGLIRVTLANKSGYINLSDQVVIAPQYESAVSSSFTPSIRAHPTSTTASPRCRRAKARLTSIPPARWSGNRRRARMHGGNAAGIAREAATMWLITAQARSRALTALAT